MRSINIYWSLGKPDRRRKTLRPLRRKAVQNRFTAMECMAASAALAAAVGAPCGAYPLLPNGFERMCSGELKMKMCGNDIVKELRSGDDA